MGSCVSKEGSSTIWGGEDWGSLSPAPPQEQENEFYDGVIGLKAKKMEGQSLIGEEQQVKAATYSPSTRKVTGTEVKIKITKKQLEEILSTVELQGKGQSLKHVLTELINLGAQGNEAYRQKPWRPALQSIPEADGGC